ncbi:MAG: dihydroorotase [Planctomycetes bacterium]|nr:dihydroorotase [Planctomycetota bacterium]
MVRTMRLTLLQPDDWHLHLRDGAALRDVVGHTARHFARAIVMPNLKPPVRTVAEARAYRDRILAALPAGTAFEPLMTLYLTERTTVEEIAAARVSGFVHAVKYYPAGATTNSDAGVSDLDRVRPVFEAMQAHDLPLLVHGEVTDPEVDVFDRERAFVERHLAGIVRDFPALRVVLEHVTTAEGVAFVQQAGRHVAATVTPQHLLWNRGELFRGGLRPHAWCLPVLKREHHRQAVLAAATTGDRFFLGTDSAPHARSAKQSDCGCAGIFSAHAALELYAEAFDAVGRLDRLEAFASERGPDFYGLPRNTRRIALERAEVTVPAELPFGDERLVPMRAGGTLHWRIREDDV